MRSFIPTAIMAPLAMVAGVSLVAVPARAQEAGIDPAAIIERVLAVDAQQRETLKDATFQSEYIEGEQTDEGFKEKLRFVKKVYVKYLKDTAWYHDDYLEYYKEGTLQSVKDRDEIAAERKAKKARRKSRDISYDMLTPFKAAQRELYKIDYKGVAPGRIDDRACHHFVVSAKEPTDQLINGDYYFEAESFHLVRVDFAPAKLTKSVWFKLSKLDMSISYSPAGDGYWLPARFFLVGKGKATLFIGVNFGGTEYFRNPAINSGLSDQLFEVKDGK
ncbi:MAG: hypothetical protein HY851_06075 [candidate division Zixibacteria bacterium]|nr:hypothetical protein [candidate division Zixibacteria bacterium]